MLKVVLRRVHDAIYDVTVPRVHDAIFDTAVRRVYGVVYTIAVRRHAHLHTHIGSGRAAGQIVIRNPLSGGVDHFAGVDGRTEAICDTL